MSALTLPTLPRGRPSAASKAAHEATVVDWCTEIRKIRSRLDFPISARGWCYVLEGCGLSKGDFNRAEQLINDCRKNGRLPLSICATDDSREFSCLEYVDRYSTPESKARDAIESIFSKHQCYTPFSFYDPPT